MNELFHPFVMLVTLQSDFQRASSQTMDSLVRMRYLFDTLQPNEQQEAIKRLATTCGMQLIITLIFNHFAKRLPSNSADQSTISVIIKKISSVITDRKSEAQSNNIDSRNDNESDTEEDPISIEEIPPVMISEIGSYLHQNDYIQFMHSSRRILIGCHSPFSLHHLTVHSRNYTTIGVRSATSVRSLALRFEHFDILGTAGNYDYSPQIERLTLYDELQQRSTASILTRPSRRRLRFLRFINQFPNSKCIDIPRQIWIDFNNETDNDIPTMPALKGTVYYFSQHICSQIQRSLLEKHATQIESLKVILECGVRASSPDLALRNLKEIKWVENGGHYDQFENENPIDIVLVLTSQCPQIQTWLQSMGYHGTVTTSRTYAVQFLTSLVDSQPVFNEKIKLIQQQLKQRRVSEWIEQSQKLEIFSIDCSRVPFVAELITFLIEKQPNLQFLEFRYDGSNEIGFLQQIESGLFMSKLKEKGKENEKKEFRVRIRFGWKRMLIGSTVMDALGHLVQTLGVCNVQHFMVQMIARLGDFPVDSDGLYEGISKSKVDGMLQKWREEYRVDSFFDEGENCQWRITFCNKDNPMEGGYGAHGLFVE